MHMSRLLRLLSIVALVSVTFGAVLVPSIVLAQDEEGGEAEEVELFY